MRIVADEAIGWVEAAFGQLGRLRTMPGHAIDRAAVRNADVLLTRSVTRVDAALLSGSSVRFVGSCTAGIDHVEVDQLHQRGVGFAFAPGCNARAVAEYVVTGLHALWARTPAGTPLGPIAVVGFGQIGRRVTRLLRALGHDVRVSDPILASKVQSAAGGADDPLDRMLENERFLSLEAAMRGARAITLHVPLTHDGPHSTVHLLDEPRLHQLLPGAIVVNTSRGSVVDNAALEAWARTTGGRVILDVWEGEPNLRWSLLAGAPSPVRLATPHVAGYTREGKAEATGMVLRALASWLGRPPVFDPTDVVGRPGSERLVPRSAGDLPVPHDGRASLARCLLAVRPLDHDDASVRALERLPLRDRALAFEALRKAYALRRELAHYHVEASDLAGMSDHGLPCSAASSLSALGVTIGS